MTAVVRRSRVRAVKCALIGRHDWSGKHGFTIVSDPYCVRCGHEGPTFLARHGKLLRWFPVQIRRGRWHFSLGLGLYHILAIRLKLVWREWGGVHPSIGIEADVWRLRVWVTVGGFYLGDDDAERSLLFVGATFNTDDLARHVCRAIGHDAPDGRAYCERCFERADGR